MATIKEDYVSFEISKLLKEKGFDVPTRAFYNPKKDYILRIDSCLIDRNAGIWVSAPTYQMAMKWLREVYNRFIEVQTDKGYDFKSIVFRPAIYDGDLYCLWESDKYKSYEEACEVAIKYCLENLI